MKIKRFFLILLLVALVFIGTSCETNCNVQLTPNPGDYDVSTFDDFTKELFTKLVGQDEFTINRLFENPEDYGLSHYEPSLPTPSLTNVTGLLVLNFVLGGINGFRYEELNDDQKMTYNIIMNLLDNINAQTPEMGYLSNNYLGSYLGYQAQLPLLLVEYNFRTKLDVENYFKYLDLIPETFQKYVDFEVEKAENGYGMPDFVIDKVVSQCEDFIGLANNQEHFMISTVNKKIDNCEFLTDEEKTNFKTLNIEKVNGPLIQGYKIVLEQLPTLKGKAKNNMGLAHHIDKNGKLIGRDYYEIDFKNTVGYDISVEEAKQYIDGLIEYYQSSLNKYKELYQNDPVFRNEVDTYQLMDTTPENQLEYYQQVIGDYFPSVSYDGEINIKYLDKAMEDHFSPAAYMVSAIDNLTEEFIYLNGGKIKDNDGNLNYNYLYPTLAHEGFPGHLYQNIYFKNTESNIIRKVLKSSGYTEGWATYAEIFSYEFLRGKYSDNFIDYLIFEDELNGAMYCRLDMGIHYDGWTLEQTNEFLQDFIPGITIDKVQAVYEQIIEVPNNMQMYFFSYFKIKDLRTKVQELSGENFNYIDFHKHILDCGPAPLKYVEEYVLSKYE